MKNALFLLFICSGLALMISDCKCFDRSRQTQQVPPPPAWVEIQVTDYSNGQPVPNARVRFRGAGADLDTTDNNGKARVLVNNANELEFIKANYDTLYVLFEQVVFNDSTGLTEIVLYLHPAMPAADKGKVEGSIQNAGKPCNIIHVRNFDTADTVACNDQGLFSLTFNNQPADYYIGFKLDNTRTMKIKIKNKGKKTKVDVKLNQIKILN